MVEVVTERGGGTYKYVLSRASAHRKQVYTVKNQFMPLNTSQGQQNPPEQRASSSEWLTAETGGTDGTQSGISELSSGRHSEESPPQETWRPAGKGLLSGWKIQHNQLQPPPDADPDMGFPAAMSVAEVDTLKQPAILQPISQANNVQSSVLEQLSPHQSGVGQWPLVESNRQAWQMGQMGQMGQAGQAGQTPYNLLAIPPVVQPMSPVQAMQQGQPFVPFAAQPQTANAQSQPLFGVMPSQPLASPQAQWQSNSIGNAPAGPPPFVQGPPNGGQGPRGKNGRGGKKKRRFPIWARVAVAVLLVLLILTGSGVYYYEANFASPVSNIVGQSAPLIKGEDNPNVSRSNSDILSGGRINILLLGSDDDQKFQGNYLLAQTDIVVTIDPATRTVGMLSIPRDLYINVPGFGMLKLDEAYAYGEKYLHNGVGLSRLTIFQDFGIPINYYAWVGLSGFIKVVDTAGGVDVDVMHPITDDIYPDDTGNSQNAYAYKRLYLAAGPQHLDGPTALEYVRSRHADLVGDFGRSARQQQVLSQLKSKLTSSPDIIAKLPALANDLNGYLKTDMQLLDVVKLMNFARTIDPNKIQRVILSPPTFSSGGVAASGVDAGESIFNPICGTIQQAIAKMFALGNNAKCNIQASSSNNQPGLASTTQTTQAAISAFQTPMDSALQTFGQLASMSLNGGSNAIDAGMRSLLDLLFMVVFESPIAMGS